MGCNQRKDITDVFRNIYTKLLLDIGKDYGTVTHWAKLELPNTEQECNDLQQVIRKKYPVDLFNSIRFILDPDGLLSNDIVNVAFGEQTKNNQIYKKKKKKKKKK